VGAPGSLVLRARAAPSSISGRTVTRGSPQGHPLRGYAGLAAAAPPDRALSSQIPRVAWARVPAGSRRCARARPGPRSRALAKPSPRTT
jgi:hypothetical protein